jgi:membrane-bound lytic murein transglycosylase B
VGPRAHRVEKKADTKISPLLSYWQPVPGLLKAGIFGRTGRV